jgi:hypothetical protein
MSAAEATHEYEYRVYDVGDNGEFCNWATIDYLVNGKVVETERFLGSWEEPGATGEEQALSSGAAWHEAQTYTFEERLGPYGIEWQREQDDRHGAPQAPSTYQVWHQVSDRAKALDSDDIPF